MPVSQTLERALGRLGYQSDFIAQQVAPPGLSERLSSLAFFQNAPKDLRTAALGADVARSPAQVETIRNLARAAAAPFALVALDEALLLFQLGADLLSDRQIETVKMTKDFSPAVSRALAPEAVRDAKLRGRQLTLFPIDATLLTRARGRSVRILTQRVEQAFALAQEFQRWSPIDAARAVIGSLAAVIVRDKYSVRASMPSMVIDAVMARHGDYFEPLAALDAESSGMVAQLVNALQEGLDYTAVDARSINEVYENLAVSRDLRNELGIFYTPPAFADRLVQNLPVEIIEPESRSVLDPACGSGNLLLAALERLEGLTPMDWDPLVTHDWVKTRVSGLDVDEVAVQIAKLSLLVSSLPFGNNWKVDRRDFLMDPPDISPTIIVSNPPWRTQRGKRDEMANRFLHAALEQLAGGGILACVLPTTWLSSETGRSMRSVLIERCELFEVWRMPRDMFDNVRYPPAVVFARKTTDHKRRHYALRWVAAGKERREAFLASNLTTYSQLVDLIDGRGFATGPLDEYTREREAATLSSIASFVSGVVQRPLVSAHPDGVYRALPRGVPYKPYSTVSLESTVPISNSADFAVGNRNMDAFRSPQVLVQSNRDPETAWRIRPVLDLVGVVPANVWHAIQPLRTDIDEAYAILALLAASPASAWLYGRVATRNIPIAELSRLPVPDPWSEFRSEFAELGRELASGPSPQLMSAIEFTARRAYEFTDETYAALVELMRASSAPENAYRFPQPTVFDAVLDRPHALIPESAPESVPGAVLDVVDHRLRIWTLGGPEEGVALDLPRNLPGWLATPGAVFDVVGGDLRFADYQLHSSAFRTDAELFGLEP